MKQLNLTNALRLNSAKTHYEAIATDSLDFRYLITISTAEYLRNGGGKDYTIENLFSNKFLIANKDAYVINI